MSIYFITGGLGFLGQYIVQALHKHDPAAELRILGRTRRKTHLGVENMAEVRFIQGDLSDAASFKSALQGVDTVIHNAAMVSFSRKDADAIYRANVIGTRNLAQAAIAAGVKNFIFISSISAVGHKKGKLSDESMYPNADYKEKYDMYGYSKMLNEAELRTLKEKMRIIILNPSLVLGPGSERIESAFRAANRLPIVPMLSYINSFVDARDVAQAVILSLTKGRNGERYIVTAHNADMLDATRLAVEASGKKAPVLQISRQGLRALDGLVYLLDKLKLNPGIRLPSEMAVDKSYSSEKIRQEMGWQPAYTLEETISYSVAGENNE